MWESPSRPPTSARTTRTSRARASARGRPRIAPTASRRSSRTTRATGSASCSGGSEGGLRHHAVDALADVDHLADATIRDHRGERVRLVAVEPLGGEEVHRLVQRIEERLLQILVEAHLDPVGLRLDARPGELDVLAHDRLQPDLLVRALEGGEVDLAVALGAVRVARPDQASLEEHRNVDGAPL